MSLSAHEQEGYSSHFVVQYGILKRLILSLNGYCLEVNQKFFLKSV